MDIATQKKLEDLKTELAPLAAQLTARNQTVVQGALQSAAQDFRAHFEGLGFQITSNPPNRTSAKYQSLEFVLESDDSPRIGCWAVLDVQQVTPKHAPVAVAVVRKGSKGPSVSFSSGQVDPVGQLQKQVDETKAALAGPALELEFQVVEQAVTPRGAPIQGARNFSNYPTFAELLKDRFK